MSGPMQIDVLTVFPGMLRGFLEESMLRRAAKLGRVVFRTVDLRDFAHDARRTADDRPYGLIEATVARDASVDVSHAYDPGQAW